MSDRATEVCIEDKGRGQKKTTEVFWLELDIEQKIERMRSIVAQQEERMDYLQDQVWGLQHQMKHHRHVEDKILVPIVEIPTGIPGNRLDRDKRYF